MRAIGAGAAVLALAWLVLPRLGLPPFSAHMTTHMAVVAVAAPLIGLGLSHRRAPIGAVPASVVELVAVWGWHMPALHHAARHDALAFAAEQGTFLVAGVLLWMAAFDARRRLDGVMALLLTSMHMTLLGALLALATRPLYGHGALLDQQVGGAIMLLVGGAAYLAGGLWLVRPLVRA